MTGSKTCLLLMKRKTHLPTWGYFPCLYGARAPSYMDLKLTYPRWGLLPPDQGKNCHPLACKGKSTHHFQPWKCYSHFNLLPTWWATPRPHDASLTLVNRTVVPWQAQPSTTPLVRIARVTAWTAKCALPLFLIPYNMEIFAEVISTYICHHEYVHIR